MKKILISQKDLHATRAGVPRKVHEEIKFFAQKGHVPYAIAERIDTEAVTESGGTSIKTFRWPISGFYRRVNYMKKVEKAVKKLQPDLVIGHGDIVNQDIAYIHNCVHLAYEKINGKKIPEDHEVARIHEMILREQKFKVLVCNSGLMRNDLMKRFNIPEDKIEVIHPEYSPAKFNTKPCPAAAEKRAVLGLSDSDIVVGLITSGNFKKRNLSLLIEAAGKLKKETELEFKVLVAGKDKAEKYKQRIQELELTDMFVFAPSINNVEAYYHAVDVFTLPAHIEEFGRSVLEAMACGKPVITTDMTGASELIEGESKDYILKEKTAEEFAEKLKRLIESKDLRDKLGALNAQTAVKHSDQARADDFGRMLEKYGFDF